jgi:hypothetical protein
VRQPRQLRQIEVLHQQLSWEYIFILSVTVVLFSSSRKEQYDLLSLFDID